MSACLSNIVLDELDRELERRHRFVRYADDCNIYVRSRGAGQRVMTNVTRFLTRRARGISLEQMLKELTAYLRGWKSYFGFCQTPSLLQQLDQWIRHRLRSMIWKRWKRGKRRYGKLRQRGVGTALAAQTAGSPHGPWRVANSPALSIALPLAYFDSLGLPRLFDGLA